MIVMTVLMYISQTMFLVLGILLNFVQAGDYLIYIFIGLGMGFGVLALIPAIINIVLSFIGCFSAPIAHTTSSLVIKLILLPWQALNFYVWLFVVAVCANPWLFLAVPIVIFLGLSTSYLYILSSSSPNIAFIISSLKSKKLRDTGALLCSLIFHFIFILDAVGAIMLSFILKKGSAKPIEKDKSRIPSLINGKDEVQ